MKEFRVTVGAIALIGMLGVFLAAAGRSAEEPKAPPPVPSPEAEAIVRNFVAALNQSDLQQALTFVVGAKADPIITQMEKDLKSEGKIAFSIERLSSAIGEKNVTVQLSGTLKVVGMEDSTKEFEDSLALSNDGNGWKLIPDDPKALNPAHGRAVRIISSMVYTLAHPADAQASAQSAACLANMRTLTDAVQQMLDEKDFNDWFLFTNAMARFARDNYRRTPNKAKTPSRLAVVLMHYFKDDSAMYCPDDKGTAESYSFNINLENKPRDAVKDPSNTVMLYEGRDGQLDFRHNGTAGVVLVDGLGLFVNREQAKKLRWKP